MTNQNTRDSYIFYRSFYEAIKELPSENQLEIYNAIAEYSLNFKEIELSGLSKTIFTLIKPQLQANNKRFIVGQKGAKHGKKGGRPKNIKPQNNPNGDKKNYPKETPNNNVNVNENVLNVNNNEECKSKNSVFKKPTLEQVKEYNDSRGGYVVANKFYDYYEAGNWKDQSGKKIKNWKQKLITWEKKNNKNSPENLTGDSFDRVLKEIKSDQLKLK
jgi:hypothetical protein